MQLLENNGYGRADVLDQFTTPGNTLRFRYELLNRSNETQGFLDTAVRGGTVEHNYLSAIKRTAKLSIHNADASGIDFTSDRIRPWVGLQMPDGGWADWPSGVFLLNSPVRKWQRGTVARDVDGYDQCQILTDSKLYKTLVLRPGVVITDQIAHMMIGIPDVIIVDSDATLPAVRTWDPGTDYLTVINDLLASIGYAALWFDGYGMGHCEPYQDPDDVDILMTYTTTDRSIVMPDVQQSLDLFSVPNFVTLIVSEPDRPAMSATFINSDPNSPVSTVNRHRVSYVETVNGAASQSVLNAMVRRKAMGFANIYEYLDFPTLLVPIHENRDTVMIVHDGLGISSKFVETAWKMELKAGGKMDHTLRRVVNIDGSLIGDPTDEEM